MRKLGHAWKGKKTNSLLNKSNVKLKRFSKGKSRCLRFCALISIPRILKINYYWLEGTISSNVKFVGAYSFTTLPLSNNNGLLFKWSLLSVLFRVSWEEQFYKEPVWMTRNYTWSCCFTQQQESIAASERWDKVQAKLVLYEMFVK